MSLTRPLIYCAPHNAVNNLQVASAGWLQGTCRLHSWASSHSVMKDKVISAGVQVFPSQRNRTWRVPYLQRSRNNFCFLSVCLFGRWQQGRPKCDILFLKFFCLFSFWNCFLSSHSCCSYWHAWRLCRYQISAYTWIFSTSDEQVPCCWLILSPLQPDFWGCSNSVSARPSHGDTRLPPTGRAERRQLAQGSLGSPTPVVPEGFGEPPCSRRETSENRGLTVF